MRMTITRAATIDYIQGLHDADKPGAFRLVFKDCTFVTIQSKNIEKFARYFGCDGVDGDLQRKINGQRIIYCMNFWQELKGFTPAEQWDGVEMIDGNFLIDRCDC